MRTRWFLVLVAVALAAKFLQVNIINFLYDPATITNGHPLVGFLSNLGVLFWCAATCICLFTAVLLRTRGAREIYLFVLSAGIVSAILTLDDLFMFHDFDGLAKRYLGLGEEVADVILAVIVAVFLIRFRKTILQSEFGLLLLALGLGVLSIYIDLYIPHLEDLDNWRNLAEDGLKWLAIVSWFTYYVRYCYRALVGLDRFK